jgi:cbb3-type cytochrome oxidase maturation protein
MEAIFFLISIGLIVTIGFLISFLWAVRKGQYEDTYSPSVRILFDDAKKGTTKDLTNSKNKINKKSNT